MSRQIDLHKTLEHNNIKPKQLAKATGKHYQTVRAWLKGVNPMSETSQIAVKDWFERHNFTIIYLQK